MLQVGLEVCKTKVVKKQPVLDDEDYDDMPSLQASCAAFSTAEGAHRSGCPADTGQQRLQNVTTMKKVVIYYEDND